MRKNVLAKALWILLGLITIAKAIAIGMVYSSLPPRIAVHFDLHGVPNGFQDRWGIWELFAIDLGTMLVFWAVTRMPSSLITGMNDIPEDQRPEARANLSLTLSIIAIVTSLIIAWAEYYIVAHN